MKITFTAVLVIICSCCLGQNFKQSDFVKIPVPALRSKEWYAYNLSSPVSFAVSIVAGKLIIEKGKEGTIKQIRTDKAKLIAIDAGEWWGGLYLKPDDENEKVYYI